MSFVVFFSRLRPSPSLSPPNRSDISKIFLTTTAEGNHRVVELLELVSRRYWYYERKFLEVYRGRNVSWDQSSALVGGGRCAEVGSEIPVRPLDTGPSRCPEVGSEEPPRERERQAARTTRHTRVSFQRPVRRDRPRVPRVSLRSSAARQGRRKQAAAGGRQDHDTPCERWASATRTFLHAKAKPFSPVPGARRGSAEASGSQYWAKQRQLASTFPSRHSSFTRDPQEAPSRERVNEASATKAPLERPEGDRPPVRPERTGPRQAESTISTWATWSRREPRTRHSSRARADPRTRSAARDPQPRLQPEASP